MPRFFKRLTVVFFFFPMLFGWMLFGWIPWLITGRYQAPWTEYLINWAKYDDFTDIPF